MSTAVRGQIITYTGKLVIEECSVCHTSYAIPADLEKRARESSDVTFYCPLGHSQHYATSEAQKLRDQLAREQTWRKNAETREQAARDQADAAERSARAYRGHLTRARKRIANGVCPCCDRHFANVERHMAGQHPDYAADVDL